MFTMTLSSLNEPAKGVLEPIQKFNQKAIANMEKLATRQMDSLKVYLDLGTSQLKAAADVRDFGGLQTLLFRQTDVLKNATERFVADARAFVEIGVESVSEAAKLSAEPAAPKKSKAA